jgi:Tol biopolymer transport system component
MDPSASAYDYYAAALSPDGSTFALSREYQPEIHIRLLSLSGGSDREITVKSWPGVSMRSLYWSPDGKGLYCGSLAFRGPTILYVDLKGNARVMWQFKGSAAPTWGVPSPNGRYLAMRNTLTTSNMWMLEGF